MRRTPFAFALLILLAAACHRQAGDTSAANAPAQGSAALDESGSNHDPHAMTSIDVATGDLAGFANYAGGRSYAPPAGHTAGLPAATAALPTMPVASVAASDEDVGEQSGIVSLPSPPTAPAGSGQVGPSGSPGAQAP